MCESLVKLIPYIEYFAKVFMPLELLHTVATVPCQSTGRSDNLRSISTC